jgi:hypothetical protein
MIEMLPEYDFRGGVRGKHAQSLQQGYTVRVQRSDGIVTVQRVSLSQKTVTTNKRQNRRRKP